MKAERPVLIPGRYTWVALGLLVRYLISPTTGIDPVAIPLLLVAAALSLRRIFKTGDGGPSGGWMHLLSGCAVSELQLAPEVIMPAMLTAFSYQCARTSGLLVFRPRRRERGSPLLGSVGRSPIFSPPLGELGCYP